MEHLRFFQSWKKKKIDELRVATDRIKKKTTCF